MADRISYGPLTLFESDAYKQARAMQAEENSLKMEKLQFDLAKAREEQEMSSPSGRSTKAAEIAATLEQDKQRQFGTPIQEEMAQRMTSAGGPGILDATRMQAELDVSAKAGEAKRAALMNFAAGEKSLLPTANVDLGGVKQTVLATEAGKTTSNIYGQIYQSQVPRLADTYIAEGYDRDTAVRMASADIRKELVKASTGGKVILAVGDGTISYSNEEAERKWRDPQTPKVIKTQLNSIFGQQEEPQAASWIKTRLGR
jgi:hypothetical protein